MKQSTKRILPLLLAVMLVLSGIPVFAADTTSGRITDFEELPPLNAEVGVSLNQLDLPKTLAATLLPEAVGTSTDLPEERPVQLTVSKWICTTEGGYQPDINGAFYEFAPTLALPEGVVLGEGVEAPTVYVIVGTPGIMTTAFGIHTVGPFTVVGNDSEFNYDSTNKVLMILDGAMLEIGGDTTDHRIVIDQDAEAAIKLKELNIDVSGTNEASAFSVMDGATLDLTLEGENTLKSGMYCAGLSVPSSAEITITAQDHSHSLTAIGGYGGAGIGGGESTDAGTVNIVGGTVMATGGQVAAAILAMPATAEP